MSEVKKALANLDAVIKSVELALEIANHAPDQDIENNATSLYGYSDPKKLLSSSDRVNLAFKRVEEYRQQLLAQPASEAKSEIRGTTVGMPTTGFMTGCAQSDPVPPPLQTELPPDSENPDPNEIDQDAISRITSDYAEGTCFTPVNLVADTESFVMLCGDDPEVDTDGSGSAPGAARIEFIDANGEVSSDNVPAYLDDNPEKPVRVSAGAVSSSHIYLGLRPGGTTADLISGGYQSFENTGIYAVSKDGADLSHVAFPQIEQEVALETEVAGVAQATAPFLQPNTPAGMVVSGNTLWAVMRNIYYHHEADQAGEDPIGLAPTSVHQFSIGDNGELTEVGAPVVLQGQYNAQAMADLGNGYVAVLTRGVGTSNDNAGTIVLVNQENPSERSTINITDSEGNGRISASFNQLPIITINDELHALVAMEDGKRVGIVNLASGETTYTGVFTVSDAHINSIVLGNGENAIVMNNEGQVRTLFLDQENFGKVGPTGELPENPKVAARLDQQILVAHNNPNNSSDDPTLSYSLVELK